MAIDLKNLDFKTAGFWPKPVQYAAFIIVFITVLGLSWLLWFSSQLEELNKLEKDEITLREEFEEAQIKANNLDNLKQQLVEIDELLKQLVLQLPNKNEIPELIVNVSQAAIANNLEADLFEPQDENKQEFYAEKRINVKFRGGYHQLGSFFSEVANQPRLISVVIDDMKVNVLPIEDKTIATDTRSQSMGNLLSFEGSVRTYRYLSEEEEAEMAEMAREAEKASKKKKK